MIILMIIRNPSTYRRRIAVSIIFDSVRDAHTVPHCSDKSLHNDHVDSRPAMYSYVSPRMLLVMMLSPMTQSDLQNVTLHSMWKRNFA
jgi:hypothetical protein